MCRALKERIEVSKRLRGATRKELKKWKVYSYRDEKWRKLPRICRIFKSAFGLWGIDSKEEICILLEDVLIVKKRRNPMRGAFDAIKLTKE